MAHQGYIVISAEYRRGRALTDSIAGTQVVAGVTKNITYTTAQQALCYYRAFQDIRGAIRTIIKRNRETATPYKFDSTNIFLGGFSAGAICAINAAYYPTQALLDSIDQGAHNVLGPVDADYYYREPTIQYHSKIRGVSSCWGNAFIPKSKISSPQTFFPASDTIPMIMFHGELDWEVCPYDYQGVYFTDTGMVTTSQYDPTHTVIANPENRCLPDNRTFYMFSGKDPGPFNNPPPDIDAYRVGAKKMYCFLKSIGVYTELFADPQMAHGVQTVPPDDFGLGDSVSVDNVFIYIGGQIATFFQAILYNKTHPGFTNILKNKRTYFRDCVNYRHSCDTTNNNACSGSEPAGFCN